MRLSRKCYESGFFHVMVQGIKKENIFNSGFLKERYMNYVTKACKKYDVKIVAYCVMDNHCHILLYAEKVDYLSKVMASVNTKYGIIYNKIKNRCGYVFRDRYRCENIYTQTYLENCIRYIHNNPVKAQMCEHQGDYPYSSYRQYANNSVSKDIMELVFKDKNYMEILNDSEIEDAYIDISNEFGEKEKCELAENIIAEYENVNMSEIKNQAKLINDLTKRCKMKKKEIANLLEIDHRNISRILRNAEK